MPALKKIARTEEYQSLVQTGNAFNESRDCAVKAMVVVTGLSYAACREALAKQGRKDRRGTYFAQTKAALEELGYEVRKWTSSEVVGMIMSYPKKGIANITTHHPRRFPKQWANTGNLLFSVRGHIAGVRDGVVHDWSINSSRQVYMVHSVTKRA